ncbi:hypothetical protein FSP39_009158 [Pinctada imbricata]|uniref:Uncharacterized protein n=1 Tax=Pinctada imbricata TaxID=66713 RepID=A0AA89C8N6_PINIB|nr:hypothetical protein FSP39_009158 [Pinctada imbricata]
MFLIGKTHTTLSVVQEIVLQYPQYAMDDMPDDNKTAAYVEVMCGKGYSLANKARRALAPTYSILSHRIIDVVPSPLKILISIERFFSLPSIIYALVLECLCYIRLKDRLSVVRSTKRLVKHMHTLDWRYDHANSRICVGIIKYVQGDHHSACRWFGSAFVLKDKVIAPLDERGGQGEMEVEGAGGGREAGRREVRGRKWREGEWGGRREEVGWGRYNDLRTDVDMWTCIIHVTCAVQAMVISSLFNGVLARREVAQNFSRRHLLNTLLNESRYDPKIAPDFEEDYATVVTIQLYVISVDSLNEMSMDYSVDLYLRQTWYDWRLSFVNESSPFNRLELGQMMIEKVWVPDSFFSNEKKASFHTVTVPNKLMHIYRNGMIKYSVRISMTLSCNFTLRNYPFDSQVCPITIESYGYSTDNVVFVWHRKKPIYIQPNQLLAQFELNRQPIVRNCSKDYDQGSKFACIEGKLLFSRNAGYYLIQIFIPSILIVVLSWVSFWLDLEATPARISLGVLTVLTMTTQSSGVRASLPRVSYVKAIDVWMAACLIFVFASLLEFAYINVMTRRHYKRESVIGNVIKEVQNTTVSGSLEEIISAVDFRLRARRIDKISRVIFPFSFILFNLVFWLNYKVFNTDLNAF